MSVCRCRHILYVYLSVSLYVKYMSALWQKYVYCVPSVYLYIFSMSEICPCMLVCNMSTIWQRVCSVYEVCLSVYLQYVCGMCSVVMLYVVRLNPIHTGWLLRFVHLKFGCASDSSKGAKLIFVSKIFICTLIYMVLKMHKFS